MNTVTTDSCRICMQPSRFAFSQRLMGNDVSYFDCPTCGYLQTEAPYWLKQAYSNAINDRDTGILVRNEQNVGRVIMTLLALGKLGGSVIDHAGGYGVLVRMLRDAGVDAQWSDKYCDNLFAKGFEAETNSCDLLTAFEVFEHLVDPVNELRKLLSYTPVVLLSTDLITTVNTPPMNWWYLGLDHGQHIGFFRKVTLAAMAQQVGCSCVSDGKYLHVFSRKKVPRALPFLLKRSRWWRLATSLASLRSKTMDDHYRVTDNIDSKPK